MWKPIYDPGPWMAFLKRKDIVGLPLMEAKKKYMQEQLLFESYVSTLQTLNSMSPGLGGAGGGGAAGGEKPTPPDPGRRPQNLCLAYDDGSNAYGLIKLEGGDENIPTTYYVLGETHVEWLEGDINNAAVLIWNGSTWGLWYYNDAAAEIWVDNVNYTDWEGNPALSRGPWDDKFSGGLDPNSPVGTTFDLGQYGVIGVPCSPDAGKEWKDDKYHIISREYNHYDNPDLVPDYIGRSYNFTDGYAQLIQTGSDFFNPSTPLPKWHVTEVYYSTPNSAYGFSASTSQISNVTYPNLFSLTKLGGNPTALVGPYGRLDKPDASRAYIEKGDIPDVITYSATYNSGKGTQTSYYPYHGKNPDGSPYYFYLNLSEPNAVLYWNGSNWVFDPSQGGSGTVGSSNPNDASGVYVHASVTYTLAIAQTNANG